MLMDPNTNLIIEDIESFEIYLPHFNKICYDNSEVDVSLSLFSASSYSEMRKLTSNPKDLLVIKELGKMAMEEDWVFAYDHEIVRKKTENSIRFESYQKGLEEGKEEIAKNLLKLGNISIEDISKSTGLTIEEISKLQND